MVVAFALGAAPGYAQESNPCGVAAAPRARWPEPSPTRRVDEWAAPPSPSPAQLDHSRPSPTRTAGSQSSYPAGSHRLEVTRDGFEAVTRTVLVTPGATVPLDVVLQVATLADAVTVRRPGNNRRQAG